MQKEIIQQAIILKVPLTTVWVGESVSIKEGDYVNVIGSETDNQNVEWFEVEFNNEVGWYSAHFEKHNLHFITN